MHIMPILLNHSPLVRRCSDDLLVGVVSVSDRASCGDYNDEGVPTLCGWLDEALITTWQRCTHVISDEFALIRDTLITIVDRVGCDLVLTTGGTGPARRDVTPEATLAAGTREMPGFGEQMRQVSLHFVPTAMLSRQTAVLRETDTHTALIMNLPGQPKAIRQTLEGVRADDGTLLVPGVFAAVPYCIQLISGPYVETNSAIVKAYRPPTALRPSKPGVQ